MSPSPSPPLPPASSLSFPSFNLPPFSTTSLGNSASVDRDDDPDFPPLPVSPVVAALATILGEMTGSLSLLVKAVVAAVSSVLSSTLLGVVPDGFFGVGGAVLVDFGLVLPRLVSPVG